MTEQERVQRFEAAYNRIDRALVDLLTDQREEARRRTFAARVRAAAHRMRRLARHVDFLLDVGDLRNALIHNRYGDDVYIAVPNEQTVLQMEAIDSLIVAPETALPRFERKVRILDADATLADAWNVMRQDGYSRYPIYERGSFLGLLTSDGFARWLAAQAHGGRLEVDGRAVLLREVLAADHRRDAAAFVPAEAPIEELTEMFRSDPRLEAILVTRHGRRNEPPLGLVCAGDLLSARGA